MENFKKFIMMLNEGVCPDCGKDPCVCEKKPVKENDLKDTDNDDTPEIKEKKKNESADAKDDKKDLSEEEELIADIEECLPNLGFEDLKRISEICKESKKK